MTVPIDLFQKQTGLSFAFFTQMPLHIKVVKKLSHSDLSSSDQPISIDSIQFWVVPVSTGSTAWAKEKMFELFNTWRREIEILYLELHPMKSLRPNTIQIREPISHARHLLMIGRESMKFFQITEVPCVLWVSLRSEEMRSIPWKYFLQRTEFQRPEPNKRLQQDFASNDCANHEISLMPHHPKCFGLAIFFHLVRWNPKPFLPPFEMNFEIKFWIRRRTIIGILTRLSQ